MSFYEQFLREGYALIKVILLLTGLFISGRLLALDVFFVHSYHYDYPWLQTYYQAFKKKLTTESLEDFQMDTKRLPESEFILQADQALSLITKKKPEVIVLADDNALKYVGPRAWAAGFPIVFLGINSNPRYYLNLDERVSGVLERSLIKVAITSLMKVNPDIRKVLLLMDGGVTSEAILETTFHNQKHNKIGWVKTDVMLTSQFSEWKSRVKNARMQGYDLIMIGNYARMADKNSQPVNVRTVGEWTGKHSEIPVFSFWRYGVKKGMAIGGLVMSGEAQGEEAATIVNQFLANKKFTRPLIRTPSRGKYVFSRSELKRWNIKLPTDISEQVNWRE